MTPEGKVKAQVRALLKEREVWCYMPVQNGMGVVGIPDLIACVPVEITADMVGKKLGVFAGIETKAPGKAKNTTANQKRHLENIHNAGGVAVVATSSDIVDEAIEKVRTYGEAIYSVP